MVNEKNRKYRGIFWLAAVFYFLLYSFLGWVTDSVYNSLTHWYWQPGGLFRSLFWPLPFAPIYGFGAWVLILLKQFFGRFHRVWLFIAAGIYASAVEYLGGLWMVWIFNRRAWDYSDEFLNLNGHISLWHTFLWCVLGWLFIWFIHPMGRWLFEKIFGGLRK